MRPPIGMMQGRLSPPPEGKIQAFPKLTWREEFARARACGFQLIEWIFEADEWAKNPLASDAGLAEIKEYSRQSGIEIQSVCADYFMDLPLVRTNSTERSERLKMLEFVIEQCRKLGVKYIGIPFVDASSIRADEAHLVAEIMRDFSTRAEKANIVLLLETDLNPTAFQDLLNKISRPSVGVNYDIGNSASLGYDSREEFEAYGPHIKTVHIKDRKKGGSTVPLGTGNADFSQTFKLLAEQGFSGPLIFQAARQGDEVENARNLLRFVDPFLKFFH